MLNDDLDVFALDEFKKLKAGRVQEVVARHGIEQNLENRLEELMLNDLSVMCFVMESNDCAEVFESGCAILVGAG